MLRLPPGAINKMFVRMRAAGLWRKRSEGQSGEWFHRVDEHNFENIRTPAEPFDPAFLAVPESALFLLDHADFLLACLTYDLGEHLDKRKPKRSMWLPSSARLGGASLTRLAAKLISHAQWGTSEKRIRTIRAGLKRLEDQDLIGRDQAGYYCLTPTAAYARAATVRGQPSEVALPELMKGDLDLTPEKLMRLAGIPRRSALRICGAVPAMTATVP